MNPNKLPVLLLALSTWSLGCADLNNPYSNPYGGGGGYDSSYGNGYNNGGYNDGRYERDRQDDYYRKRNLDRERDDLDRERRRVEDERRRLENDRNRPPPAQAYPSAPAPSQDRCPSGFSPSENKCSKEERRRGCKDMRLPSGLGCVRR